MAWDERTAQQLRARVESERRRAMRRAVDELRGALVEPPVHGQLVLAVVALHEPRQLLLPLGVRNLSA